jgi:hypothetical protein
MAISEEETKLRDETRVALLNAIKTDTELAIKSMERGSFLSGETLLHLAEAYGLLTGPSGVPKPAGRAMVG